MPAAREVTPCSSGCRRHDGCALTKSLLYAVMQTFTIALADSIPHPGHDSAQRLIAA
jgi:hypothetical protein